MSVSLSSGNIQQLFQNKQKERLKTCEICLKELHKIGRRVHLCKRCFRTVCSSCSPHKACQYTYEGKRQKKHRSCKLCIEDVNDIKRIISVSRISILKDSDYALKWLKQCNLPCEEEIKEEYQFYLFKYDQEEKDTYLQFIQNSKMRILETRKRLNYSFNELLHMSNVFYDLEHIQNAVENVVTAFYKKNNHIGHSNGTIILALLLVLFCSEASAFALLNEIYTKLIPKELYPKNLSDKKMDLTDFYQKNIERCEQALRFKQSDKNTIFNFLQSVGLRHLEGFGLNSFNIQTTIQLINYMIMEQTFQIIPDAFLASLHDVKNLVDVENQLDLGLKIVRDHTWEKLYKKVIIIQQNNQLIPSNRNHSSIIINDISRISDNDDDNIDNSHDVDLVDYSYHDEYLPKIEKKKDEIKENEKEKKSNLNRETLESHFKNISPVNHPSPSDHDHELHQDISKVSVSSYQKSDPEESKFDDSISHSDFQSIASNIEQIDNIQNINSSNLSQEDQIKLKIQKKYQTTQSDNILETTTTPQQTKQQQSQQQQNQGGRSCSEIGLISQNIKLQQLQTQNQELTEQLKFLMQENEGLMRTRSFNKVKSNTQTQQENEEMKLKYDTLNEAYENLKESHRQLADQSKEQALVIQGLHNALAALQQSKDEDYEYLKQNASSLGQMLDGENDDNIIIDRHSTNTNSENYSGMINKLRNETDQNQQNMQNQYKKLQNEQGQTDQLIKELDNKINLLIEIETNASKREVLEDIYKLMHSTGSQYKKYQTLIQQVFKNTSNSNNNNSNLSEEYNMDTLKNSQDNYAKAKKPALMKRNQKRKESGEKESCQMNECTIF